MRVELRKMTEITIRVEGDKGIAQGPFPQSFLQVLIGLSGRKKWIGNAKVQFEATAANLRKIKATELTVDWQDGDGSLASLEELASLPTQHEPTGKIFSNEYVPNISWMKHQIDTLSMSSNRVVFAHLHEMGLGKTAIMIAEAGILFQQGKLTGVLILAPKGVHRQWLREQVPEHLDKGINHVCNIWPKNLSTANSTGVLSFYSMNTDAIRTPKGFKAAQNFLIMHKGKSLMIIDESHLIKSPSAQRTKAAWKLGEIAAYKRIATGTPISKNIVDSWAQFKFLDDRILGHRYMTSFRARYCIMGGFEGRQIVGQKNTEEFYSLIAPHSFRLTKAEALNLPPKIYAAREYDMGEATKSHYDDIKKTFMTALDDGTIVDVPNAAVALTRLQQIVCGYLPGTEGKLSFFSEERLHAMMEIVEQVTGPIVIWARFIEDIHRIKARLEEEHGSEGVVTYYGATSTKERESAKTKFLNGDARFFVSNPAAGGVGLNLQGHCQNVIYYSNSFDALHRWQSEDRTHRMGTKGSVTYFDLIADKSIDRLILRNLRGKKSVSDLTFDEIRKAIQIQD